jgi:hypothetical protein
MCAYWFKLHRRNMFFVRIVSVICVCMLECEYGVLRYFARTSILAKISEFTMRNITREHESAHMLTLFCTITQVTPLVATLQNLMQAQGPHLRVLIAHKHRSDMVDSAWMHGMESAGLKVDQIPSQVGVCVCVCSVWARVYVYVCVEP